MSSYIWLIIFPPDTQGSRNKTLMLYRSFEMGNLAFTGKDSVQTLFNKIHAKTMSLFLHLKYANHKTKPIHTLAVISNSVSITVPVLLKTNDLPGKLWLDVVEILHFSKNNSLD